MPRHHGRCVDLGQRLPYANITLNVARRHGAVDFKIDRCDGSGGFRLHAHQVRRRHHVALPVTATTPTARSTITNGTLLVDNTSGSATGQSAVSVSPSGGGATLAGIGTSAASRGYANANVTVAGTSTYTATLAPGDVNLRPAPHHRHAHRRQRPQSNNVTIGNYGNWLST